MIVWMARNGARTRFRIQLESYDPRVWLGWEVRTGEITREQWIELSTVADEIEIERLHQEIWRSLEG
jgi:hypothetical protein